MKKILIVNIGTEIGGIEKCLINFLNYLTTKDCTVDVTFFKPAGPLFDQIPSGINVLDNRGVGSFKSVLKSKSIKKLFNFLKFKIYSKKGIAWKSLANIDTQYDIAISYCQNGYSPYYVIDKANAKEKYLWYHELNYSANNNKKQLDMQYFSKYTNICCVSNACKNNLQNQFSNIKDKFITIYNLYNTSEIVEKSKESFDFYDANKKSIVTVGRLSQEKGVILAIESCKKLLTKTNDFVWYWVGDGDMHHQAQQLINKYGIADNFKLLGNKTNPYPYIKNADIYVQPSLSEAYCTTIIEAKILAKPIVSTDVDSVYEQIEHNFNGLICKKDAENLADSICLLLTDNSLSSEFSSKLKCCCDNDYSAYDKLLNL